MEWRNKINKITKKFTVRQNAYTQSFEEAKKELLFIHKSISDLEG